MGWIFGSTVIVRFGGARFVIMFEGRFNVWGFNFISVFVVVICRYVSDLVLRD